MRGEEGDGREHYRLDVYQKTDFCQFLLCVQFKTTECSETESYYILQGKEDLQLSDIFPGGDNKIYSTS